jgi:hypothetical protein
MFVVSVWPSDDLRIEEHACGRLRAKCGIDETFGVNFSDAPVGAVCNKDTAVFGDGDLLRRVQFGGHRLFAVAAESCFPVPAMVVMIPLRMMRSRLLPLSEIYRLPLMSTLHP